MIKANVRSCWPRPSSAFNLLCSTSSVDFATYALTYTTRCNCLRQLNYVIQSLCKIHVLILPKWMDCVSSHFSMMTPLCVDLKKELSAYVVAAQDFEDGTAPLNWWRRQDHLPSWRKATSIILLIFFSSAAVERVFLLLEASLSSRQAWLFKDSIELSLMLQYNRGSHQRNR